MSATFFIQRLQTFFFNFSTLFTFFNVYYFHLNVYCIYDVITKGPEAKTKSDRNTRIDVNVCFDRSNFEFQRSNVKVTVLQEVDTIPNVNTAGVKRLDLISTMFEKNRSGRVDATTDNK